MQYLIRSLPRHATPVIAVALLFCACGGFAAQAPSSAPHAGLINAAGAAFNPATEKAYVVDSETNTVTVTDDRTGHAHSIVVGAGPVSVAIDTVNGHAYVANADDGTVTVLDGATDAVLATVAVGSHPYSIAADSGLGKIYVTRTFSDQLAIIDAATNQVNSIKIGSADLLAIDAKRHIVFLLGYEGGNLITLDEATLAHKETTVGMHAWGMALNNATGILYIAKIGDAAVAAIHPGASKPEFIQAGHMPCSVAVNARTNIIYAANYVDSTVTVIDGALGKAIATIRVGERPEGITVDEARNRVYVANTQGNSVTVIDGATRRILKGIGMAPTPYAIAVDPHADRIHIARVGSVASASK